MMASGTQNLTSYKANILAHTPNDTSLFLRGDNVWTNILNGTLDLKSDLNLYTSSADSPDIVWWYADKEKEQARIWMGSGSTSIFAPNYRCYASDGTSLYSGKLVIGDGTGITNAASFRDKLSTWALVSSSYNTFMPPDGTTNAWYKFGTADGYGILPALSGGAENGHSCIGTSSWYWKYLYVDRAYTGKITIQQPAAHRDNGIVGEYNYQKAGAIWSMGASYQIKADGSGLGTLYGAAYGYGGQAYLGSNAYAGGHQFLWCENGVVKVALGQNIWTAGKVTATGGFADRTNGTATYLNYGAAGLAASAISWLACWNGYELRAISKGEVFNAVRDNGGDSRWVNVTGDTMTGALSVKPSSGRSTINSVSVADQPTDFYMGSANSNKWSLTCRASGDGYFLGLFSVPDNTWRWRWNHGGTTIGYGTLALIHNSQNNSYNALLYVEHKSNNDWGIIVEKGGSYDYGIRVNCVSTGSNGINCTGRITGTKVYGAVWNDYAECRNVDINIEPGFVVYETTNKIMTKTNKRLQPGCKVVSDTYGMCIGETEEAKIPIAVTGRVLVYPYRNRFEYPLGAAVCSAPNGTVDLMTRDEIMMYPERIIGTVSEIPDYEIWHAGEQDGNHEIQVNGRIWIYVR